MWQEVLLVTSLWIAAVGLLLLVAGAADREHGHRNDADTTCHEKDE